MKRFTIAFVLVVLLGVIALLVVFRWRNAPATPFAIRPNTVVPKTKPAFSVGSQFAVMIAPDGTLWGWGSHPGMPFAVPPTSVPRQISPDTDWRQVAAGFHGFIALRQDGSLWGMGSNSEGLLGLPASTKELTTLTRLNNDNDWKDIRAGVAHCMALKRDGSLWTWGHNNYGQIGIGAITPSEPPTRVTQHTNWLAISPGAFQSQALRDDGTIWAWGLGFITSSNHPAPYQLGTNTNWTAIASGEYHLAALARDGSSWIIGANAQMMIGDKQAITNFVRLNEANDWVEIISGENCLIGRKKERGWYPTGSLAYNSANWSFPPASDLLALATQRGTTLLLTRDGRLWSLGRRVGGEPRLNLAAKIGNLFNTLTGIGTAAQPSEPTDLTPFLLWEYQ